MKLFFLFINNGMNNSELTSFPGGPTGPIIPTGPGGPCRKVINVNYNNNKAKAKNALAIINTFTFYMHHNKQLG